MICKDASSLIAIPAILASLIVATLISPLADDRSVAARCRDRSPVADIQTGRALSTVNQGSVAPRHDVGGPVNSRGPDHRIRFRPAPAAPAAAKTTLLRLLPASDRMTRPAAVREIFDDITIANPTRPLVRRQATVRPAAATLVAVAGLTTDREHAAASLTMPQPAVDVAGPGDWPGVDTLGAQLGLPSDPSIDGQSGVLLIGHRQNAAPPLTATPLTATPLTAPPLTTPTDRDEAMRRWAEQVDQAVERLRQCRRLDAPAAATVLGDLSALVPAGRAVAGERFDAGRRVDAVARRLAIWRAIAAVPRPAATVVIQTVAHRPARQSIVGADTAMIAAIGSVDAALAQTGDVDGWRRALSLTQLQKLAADGAAPADERATAAAVILSRLARPATDPAQHRLAAEASFGQLVTELRRWVDRPIVVDQLISHVEMTEAEPTGAAVDALAGQWSTMRFAGSAAVRDVADAIEQNYRDANVRVAVSEDYVRRYLPAPDVRVEPVAARVAGASVRGTSRVRSDVDLRLVPHDAGWRIDLLTDGRIDSRSVGRKSVVAVGSTAAVDFRSTTPILISPEQLRWVPPQPHDVDASVSMRMGSVRVGNVDTPLHRWPLVGPLGQKIVQRQFDDQRAAAGAQTAGRVRREVASGVAERLIQSRTDATQRAVAGLLGPLQTLSLSPKATGLRTTDANLLGEFRIAGDDQLAGVGSPEPPPAGSAVSASLHQSAINNLLDRLAPTGEPQPLVDVIERTRQLFAWSTNDRETGDTAVDPDAIDPAVRLQLTRLRPISVRFEDDEMELTIRVQELRGGDGPALRRFIVRAHYRVDQSGPSPRLVREGHLNIAGPGMSVRQRLPIRVVFNKVLSPTRTLPLLPARLVDHPASEGLSLDPVAMRGGWLTWSMSPTRSPT